MRATLAALLATFLMLAGCAATPPPLPPVPAPTPEPIEPVTFPRDDGPHQQLTEWWYYTGHLAAEDGSRYGFELVTFQALRGQNPPVYVGHFAVTDHQRHEFHFEQRAQSGQEATADTGFRLAVADWTMRGANGDDHLAAAMDGYALDVTTRSPKPPALHGGDGYVSFGPAGGSYYYSRTRLDVGGTLIDHGQPRAVRGQAWFDHQWGNFLVVGGGGWDWYSLQLDDQSELTISVVRDSQGQVALAYGTYVTADGTARHLPAEAFQARASGDWTSPHSGARYPSGWQLTLQDPPLDLTLTPVLADQELDTGRTTGAIYWEGEVTVSGARAGQPVGGDGYVELTGYAQ